LLLNKIDISGIPAGAVAGQQNVFGISAKEQTGFDGLASHLKESAGFFGDSGGLFSAR